MVGLLFDAGILTPLALIFLITLSVQRSGALVSPDLQTVMLLGGAGVVTATPLLLFAYGARRIRYSTLGIFQYIGPTGHLLVGVLLYHESFTHSHAISFGAVWAAIVMYSVSSLMNSSKRCAS